MALRFLLDTNICIYIRQERPMAVRARFGRQPAGSVAMSVVTWGELMFGAERSSAREAAIEKLQRIATQIPVLPLPQEAAVHYGEIRAQLTARGQVIGANDLWIAAHARAERLTIVTHNVSEFSRVPGLRVEDWS